MEDSVKQRLRGFLKEQNMSINQISLNANYPQSTLNKQINKETSMSLSTLLVLLDLFSELSAEWLLRGEGNMLRIATSNDTSASSDDKVKDVAYLITQAFEYRVVQFLVFSRTDVVTGDVHLDATFRVL